MCWRCKMKELNLQYERGSEPNTIDVCTQEKLFLGRIINQQFFGLGFQQATKLNDEDKNEISHVIQSIQQVV